MMTQGLLPFQYIRDKAEENLTSFAGLPLLLLRLETHGMKRRERRAYEKRWLTGYCNGSNRISALVWAKIRLRSRLSIKVIQFSDII